MLNSNYQSQYNTQQLKGKNNDISAEMSKNINSEIQNKTNVNNFLKLQNSSLNNPNNNNNKNNTNGEIYNNAAMNNYAFSIKEKEVNIKINFFRKIRKFM